MKHLLQGKRFGKLLVIKEAGRSKDRSVVWECLCDCGKTTKTTSKSLMCQDTKSCGCLRRIEAGEANFKRLHRGYKGSAKSKGISFDLSIEEFRSLVKQKCFYCNTEPLQQSNRKFSNGIYLFNGIDRIDNTKGYTKANTKPCCFICNRAKGNLPYKDFLLWIQRIKTK